MCSQLFTNFGCIRRSQNCIVQSQRAIWSTTGGTMPHTVRDNLVQIWSTQLLMFYRLLLLTKGSVILFLRSIFIPSLFIWSSFIRGEFKDKVQLTNKTKTLEGIKKCFFLPFFVYQLPIWTHFSQPCSQLLNTLAKSSSVRIPMTPSHFLMTLARRTWRGLQAPSLALGKGNSLPEPKKVDKGCWGRSWNFFGGHERLNFPEKGELGCYPRKYPLSRPQIRPFRAKSFQKLLQGTNFDRINFDPYKLWTVYILTV
jgi:hypothetical protein